MSFVSSTIHWEDYGSEVKPGDGKGGLWVWVQTGATVKYLAHILARDPKWIPNMASITPLEPRTSTKC